MSKDDKWSKYFDIRCIASHHHRRMVQCYLTGDGNVFSHDGTLAPPGEYDWICASFGPLESTTQTANRLVKPFLRSSRQKVPILYNGRPCPPELPIQMGDLDQRCVGGGRSCECRSARNLEIADWCGRLAPENSQMRTDADHSGMLILGLGLGLKAQFIGLGLGILWPWPWAFGLGLECSGLGINNKVNRHII